MKENYFLNKYGSIHNAYLEYNRIAPENGTATISIGRFLDLLQVVVESEEA